MVNASCYFSKYFNWCLNLPVLICAKLLECWARKLPSMAWFLCIRGNDCMLTSDRANNVAFSVFTSCTRMVKSGETMNDINLVFLIVTKSRNRVDLEALRLREVWTQTLPLLWRTKNSFELWCELNLMFEFARKYFHWKRVNFWCECLIACLEVLHLLGSMWVAMRRL